MLETLADIILPEEYTFCKVTFFFRGGGESGKLELSTESLGQQDDSSSAQTLMSRIQSLEPK